MNKEWNQLLEDDRDHPPIWKTVIYRELALGNDKWAQRFGKDVIAGERPGEDFATLPFKEVIRDYKNIAKVFPGKKAREALMLVRVPKTLNGELTLKSLGALAARCGLGDQNNLNNKGYRFIWDTIFNPLGNKSITESRWVLMTKDILPQSRNKSYAEQKNLVDALTAQGLNGYEVPRLLDATVCILAQYVIFNTRLFNNTPSTCTRCQEKIEGAQVIVGDFTPSGLWIDYYFRNYNAIGVASLRQL